MPSSICSICEKPQASLLLSCGEHAVHPVCGEGWVHLFRSHIPYFRVTVPCICPSSECQVPLSDRKILQILGQASILKRKEKATDLYYKNQAIRVANCCLPFEDQIPKVSRILQNIENTAVPKYPPRFEKGPKLVNRAFTPEETAKMREKLNPKVRQRLIS